MTIGVLGSGFGLYGYLPALLQLGERVAMPERYREKLLARAELRALDSSVAWLASDQEVLAASDGLIVSRRPEDQVRSVRAALGHDSVRRLLLEKPLAPTPEAARSLLAALADAERTIRIGYTFRYTAWSRRLAEWLPTAASGETLTVRWRFRAHHYAAGIETWKRRPSQGGGALRFFGIHLLALAAEHGYAEAVWSRVEGREPDDAARWEAALSGAGRPSLRILLDSDAPDREFALESEGCGDPLRINLQDPFEESTPLGALDRRVGVLIDLAQSLLSGHERVPEWYFRALDLWESAERTQFG